MNANTDQTDPKGAQLRQTLEHLTLQKMIDRLDKEDFSIKELCHLLHTCSGHKKAEAAEEKIRSTERIAIQRLNSKTNSPSPRLCRGADHQPTPPQPELIGDPNTNQPQQSHQDFCKNLTQAAMDIWGLDISNMCKTDKPESEENDPNETDDLYDIPPQYRQGATPINGSQEKYGQPKYTRKEWRKVMFRAIRDNYGIYDDKITAPRTNQFHDQQPDRAHLTLRNPFAGAIQPAAHDKNPHRSKKAHPRAPP